MAITLSGRQIRPAADISAAFRRRSFRQQPVLATKRAASWKRLVLDGISKEGGTASGLNDDLINFLRHDLPHLFDEQGIDRSMYDSVVRFRDPITKHDTIDGYLFNIRLLKVLFSPDFQLHRVWETGPCEITTRWTMVMKFILLPWKPELVFTGVSIMGVNPQTRKFCSHVDRWDSIENNEYFSVEGLLDVARQLVIFHSYGFIRLLSWKRQITRS